MREALAGLPEDSLDRRAIELLTGVKKASVAELKRALEQWQEQLDPLVTVALEQQCALGVLDGVQPGGRRAQRLTPEDAYLAISRALGTLENEMELLVGYRTAEPGLHCVAEPGSHGTAAADTQSTAAAAVPHRTAGTEPLPPAVFAALTATFIRACLATNRTGLARDALVELEKRSPGITEPHIRFHAYSALGIGYLTTGEASRSLVPATRARSIARTSGDIAGQWRAQRIRAFAATALGQSHAEESTHQEVVVLARKIATALDTEAQLRSDVIFSELESRSILARNALSNKRFERADDEAKEMIRYAARCMESGDADSAHLWQFSVDAHVTRMLVAGLAHSPSRMQPEGSRPRARGRRRAADPATKDHSTFTLDSVYDHRRREARAAIADVPGNARKKALWWNTYVDDRHGFVLAKNRETARARRVIKRALAGWRALGDESAAASCEKLLIELDQQVRT